MAAMVPVVARPRVTTVVLTAVPMAALTVVRALGTVLPTVARV